MQCCFELRLLTREPCNHPSPFNCIVDVALFVARATVATVVVYCNGIPDPEICSEPAILTACGQPFVTGTGNIMRSPLHASFAVECVARIPSIIISCQTDMNECVIEHCQSDYRNVV